MIKHKKIKFKVTALVVKDVLCNKCGESLSKIHYKTSIGDGNFIPSQIPEHLPMKNNDNHSVFLDPGQEFYGLVETEVHGGYLSTALQDYTKYRFSICEKCLVELFSTFVIPVERG